MSNETKPELTPEETAARCAELLTELSKEGHRPGCLAFELARLSAMLLAACWIRDGKKPALRILLNEAEQVYGAALLAAAQDMLQAESAKWE